jgi:hypothetical protein
MSEALQYRPAEYRRIFVEDEGRLGAIAEELSRGDAMGVDLEMVQRVHRRPGGYQEWRHVLALIQLATDDLSVVVDPVRCRDLTPLAPLLGGGIRKVFLGGGQDVSLLADSNLPVRNVVDVGEVALALFGRREDGMAALAHRIFGISLDKTVRRADWLARPLNSALLTYAHRDAELTLLIYRWFQVNYPDVVAYHERRELEPALPPGTSGWLAESMGRTPGDAIALAMQYGLDPERDGQEMAGQIRALLGSTTAPRQLNRALRIAGDLALTPLQPDVGYLLGSPSSLVRAAAARTLGQIGEPESALPLLERLRQDPSEEVRKAAALSIKELKTPRPETTVEVEEETSSLGDETRAALQALLEQLDGTAG